MIELLMALAEEIAGVSAELEGVSALNKKQTLYKQYKSQKRKYHEVRSKFAKYTNPIGYKINKGRLKFLNKYASKYLEIERKLNFDGKKYMSKKLDRLVNQKLFEKRSEELNRIKRIKRNLIRRYNRLESKIKHGQNVDPKTVDKIIFEIEEQNSKIEREKKKLRQRNTRRIRIEGNKRNLSSSFLQSGIFIFKEERKYSGVKNLERYGQLFLKMNNKEYVYDNFPQVWWISMIEAYGTNGSGAGSVLWNTFWYHKRTSSITLPAGYSIRKRSEFMSTAYDFEKEKINKFNQIQAKRAGLAKRSQYYLKMISQNQKKVIIKVRPTGKRR